MLKWVVHATSILSPFFFAIPKDQSVELVSTNVMSFSFISCIIICACLKTWTTSLHCIFRSQATKTFFTSTIIHFSLPSVILIRKSVKVGWSFKSVQTNNYFFQFRKRANRCMKTLWHTSPFDECGWNIIFSTLWYCDFKFFILGIITLG